MISYHRETRGHQFVESRSADVGAAAEESSVTGASWGAFPNARSLVHAYVPMAVGEVVQDAVLIIIQLQVATGPIASSPEAPVWKASPMLVPMDLTRGRNFKRYAHAAGPFTYSISRWPVLVCCLIVI